MKEKAPYLLTGDPAKCCACGACRQICPKGCISMEEKNGFPYPKIDAEKCIDCGLCGSVCQYAAAPARPEKPISAWGAYHKDDERHRHSTSGGVYPALAKYTVDRGGAVFGAGWTEQMSVSIQKADTLEESLAFCKSKYVFASTGDSYSQVKALLKEGRPVLFTGTPCQVAGLRSFLGKEYDLLLTMDIVCHGVPSQKALDAWLRAEAQRRGSSVTGVDFRYQPEGEAAPLLRIEFADGSVRQQLLRESAYGTVFNSNIALMPGCASCAYTDLRRCGDITIGDFWGAETEAPGIHHPDGTSAVLINTPKGAAAWEAIAPLLHTEQTAPARIAAHNLPLNRPTGSNPLAPRFLKALDKMDFFAAHQRYVKLGNLALLPYRALRALLRRIRK